MRPIPRLRTDGTATRKRVIAAPSPTRRRARRAVSLETIVGAGALLVLLGGSWDVAWHIAAGRESFWSPPHLVLYSGIALMLGASAFALAGAWRRGRRLPDPGPTIVALGAAMALASAPIDDLWHRLYGVDVTVWSPPHLLLIAGLTIATYGALAGFALDANRRDPERLTRFWRSTGAPWRARAREAGIFVAGGLALSIASGLVAEYAFDVSRYAVVYHPIALAGTSALTLTAVARAGGRVGGATMAAAAYTTVGLLLNLALAVLGYAGFQLALVLLAAPALDLVLWKLGPRYGWRAAAGGGAALALALLAVQWPYTVAANRVVWDSGVILQALVPAVVVAAIAAVLGWVAGAALRPVRRASVTGPARDRRRRQPVLESARWDGWGRRPGRLVLLAALGLVIWAIAPAALNAGAPPTLPPASFTRPGVVASLEYSPPVAIAGEPLAVVVTFNDPELLAHAPVVPFETVRAGDVISGVLRATGEPGKYFAEFVPRAPGRRWLSVFFPGAEGDVVASAMFMVYRANEVPAAPSASPRFLVMRPEAGPEAGLPEWLEPLTFVALALAVAGMVAAVGASLRRAYQIQVSAESSGTLAR